MNYQRERAEEAVRSIRGVKGVTNIIQLQPRIPPGEINERSRKPFVAARKSMQTA